MSISCWRFLASHNLALVLIGLLTLAIAAGGTLPQLDRLSPGQLNDWFGEWPVISVLFDAIGLSHVFSAWWFYLLLLLLLINLLVGTFVSVQSRLAYYSGSRTPRYESSGNGVLPDLCQLASLPQSVLAGIIAEKQGTLGLFGIPLFHIGIVMIVLAGTWSALEGYGAHFELSEGQVYEGQRGVLIADRGAYPSDQFEGRIRLNAINVEVVEKKYIKDLQATFSVQEEGSELRTVVVETNKPLYIGSYRVYPDNTMGYTAVFKRILPSGKQKQLDIRFNVPIPEWGQPYRLERIMPIELGGTSLFYKMLLVSGEPPQFKLSVTKVGSEVFKGTLKPGEVADLSDYKLEFLGVVPWLGFYLASDRPMVLMFIVFVITLIGFFLHLIIRFRRFEITADGDNWQVRVWTMRGDDQFDRQWQQWSTQVFEG